MVTVSDMNGRALAGAMVCTTLAGMMLNSIVSAPTCMLASSIAARSVHAPPAVAHVPLPGVASESSAVLSTMKVSGTAQAGAARSQRQATIAPRRWVMRILPDPLALFRASDATLGRSWEEPSSSGGRDEAQAHR